MQTENSLREVAQSVPVPAMQGTVVVDPVQAAETILRRFGPRALTLLTSPRTLDDGRSLPPRMSANDCYVALQEACRKMARVAVRKYEGSAELQGVGYAGALDRIFPDPTAYLARCIRSVVSDAERAARREIPAISMDQPLAGAGDDGGLCLRDTLADSDPYTQPEEALIERDERTAFRRALAAALTSIPKNYLEALQRDTAREREREQGNRVAPESDRERQTVCRARAALAVILKRECGTDNPFVRLVAQQKGSRVRQKSSPSPRWTRERQDELFRRLLSGSWTERAAAASHPEDDVEEAVVNELAAPGQVAAPSPEMRQAMRVMDTYTLGDNPTATCTEAQELYDRAREARRRGALEEAIRFYRSAYEQDRSFIAAYNEVGVMLSQMGNLRDALRVYIEIVDRPDAGEHRYIAATNAADIYLTWFDAGRNRERNIERATHFARLAMQKPTPMRACNLVLAFVKDQYYTDAQQVMDAILKSNMQECPADRFLQTLFQIRDSALIAWWTWLDSELGREGK